MKTVIIPAELNRLEYVMTLADEILKDTSASGEDRMAVELALEEIFVNIVNYACLKKAGEIAVSYGFDEKKEMIEIQFQDDGCPFNPLEKEEPDITAGFLERSPGGLGIYMLKQLMDEVEYEYADEKNTLTLWKRISDREGKMKMALETTETYRDDVCVVKVSGRLDAMTSEGFQKSLLEKIKKTGGDLILDCEELEFVSSAGLRIFLIGQKALQEKGQSLRLIHVSEVIMKVLIMTGFDRFLKIEQE